MRSNAFVLRRAETRPDESKVVATPIELVRAPTLRRIGDFELVREIARGGMGVIHVADRPGPGGRRERFALKTLRPDLARDTCVVDMFTAEARVLLSLRHESIVRGYEAGCNGGVHWIAMELLEGMTLSQLQREHLTEAIPLIARLRIVCDVLSALHHAHTSPTATAGSSGIVHRDVSPQNIVVTTTGRVKLLDFGVAKSSERALRSNPALLKGRASYMAPEQVTGDLVDRRADVFAVGAILRELLVGSRVWDGIGPTEHVFRLAQGEIPPFPKHVPVARELQAICEKAMAPKASDRFVNAKAMQGQIEHYIARASTRMLLGAIGRDIAEHLASSSLTRFDRSAVPLELAPTELAHPGAPRDDWGGRDDRGGRDGMPAVEGAASMAKATTTGTRRAAPPSTPPNASRGTTASGRPLSRLPRSLVIQTPTLQLVVAELESERRRAGHVASAPPPSSSPSAQGSAETEGTPNATGRRAKVRDFGAAVPHHDTWQEPFVLHEDHEEDEVSRRPMSTPLRTRPPARTHQLALAVLGIISFALTLRMAFEVSRSVVDGSIGKSVAQLFPDASS